MKTRSNLKDKNNKGNKLPLFIAFVVSAQLLFTSLFFNNAYAQDPISVAVVNVTFLMESAPQSEAASNLLKDRFSPQEEMLAKQLEQINKLEEELKKVNSTNAKGETKRQKERELRTQKRKRSRSLQDFREELRFARGAALDDVQKEVFSAIDEVRKQQNIDIVLQDYVSANKRVDITPLVLAFLKSQLEVISKSNEDNQ